jgi:hypothetical protein
MNQTKPQSPHKIFCTDTSQDLSIQHLPRCKEYTPSSFRSIPHHKKGVQVPAGETLVTTHNQKKHGYSSEESQPVLPKGETRLKEEKRGRESLSHPSIRQDVSFV